MLTIGGRVISELQVGIGIGALLAVGAMWLLVMATLVVLRVIGNSKP